MPSFQKFVLFLAIIILIIVLVLIGYSLQKASTSIWPPLVGECPDFWVDLSGNGSQCTNVKNLGNGTCKPSGSQKYLTMDFTKPIFSGGNSLCAKYQWATNCGVTWDGITYGVSNPCDASGNTLTNFSAVYNASSKP
jgi:hypothetical protein